MKIRIILTLASLALLFACQSQEMEPQGPEDNGVSKTVTQREVIITADIAEGAESIDQTTRTSVAFQGTQLKTFWSPGDPINIFSLGVSTMFTSTNTEPARKAQFRGTVTVVVGDDGESGINYLWGLYPYNVDAVYSEPDGNSATAVITTSVPDLQRGKADTFDNGVATMIGRSESFTINYKNAYSGVYVRFNKDDVISVTLKGLHDETLAGNATFGLDGNMNPVVVGEVQNPKKSITVYAPNGGTFEPGKNYFMVTLPDVALEGGYSLTVKRLGGIEATFNSLTTVKSLDRNVFKTFNNPLDTYIENATNISNGRSTGWINSSAASGQPFNEIWYTTTDGEAVDYLSAASAENTVTETVAPKDNNGVGIIRFLEPVTIIDNNAFKDVNNLETVTLPDYVERIGPSAFYSCTNLVDAYLGTSLTTIDRSAFSGCGFEEIDFLPESLKRIGSLAFDDCPNLLEVTIPESVDFLGYYSDNYDVPLGNPFAECMMLQRFNGKFASQDGRSLIMVKDDVRYLVSFATYGMDNQSYTVPPTDYISFYAFLGTTLAQVVLPESLSVISDYAFSGCEHLTSVTIPSGVQVVGGRSFDNCTSLEWIRIEASIVPSAIGTPRYASGGMFDGSSCPIYVPNNLFDSYQNTTYWLDYADRYRIIGGADGAFVYVSPFESGENW